MSQEAAYELGKIVERVLTYASVEAMPVGVDNRYILLVSVPKGNRQYSTIIQSPAEWGLLLALHEIKQERGTPVSA